MRLNTQIRFTAMSVTAVLGLLFLAGSGCSDDDKNAKIQADMLRAELAAKQGELDCKVKVLAITCGSGDTACNTAKAEALAKCNTPMPPVTGGTSTATSTSSTTTTSTSTATN